MARSEDDNVVPFPGTSGEAENAALWLVRLNGGLDAPQRARLQAWLRESPRHAQELREMAAFWGELDRLEGLDLAGTAPRTPRFMSTAVLRYAAVLVVAIGLGLAVYLREPAADAPAAVATDYEETFSTAIGERRTQTLPDGSVITLNTNTELQVRYYERSRVVELLRGEAHFAVAHNVERPFGVHAAGHVVQAVGTAFNVRLQQAGAAEVTVTEGIVRILDDAQGAAAATSALADGWWTQPALRSGLVPGQVAMLDARSPGANAPEVRELAPDALEIRLAWQDGMLIFESEPLNEVLAEFSRYTAVEFVLEDAPLGELRIGGLIPAGDIDGLLDTLRDNFQIEADVSEARIVLRQGD